MAEPVSTTVMVVKAAATALTNEKVRKGVGWIIAAILSPIIVLMALIGGLLSGGAEHNNSTLDIVFYGDAVSYNSPSEYKAFVDLVQDGFMTIDSKVATINTQTENGNGLDGVEIKSVFYVVAMESQDASTINASSLVDCFVKYEERTRVYLDEDDNEVVETYTVAVPLSRNTAYANIETTFGITISADSRTGVNEIYVRVASNGTAFSGDALRGNGSSAEIDVSSFTSPGTKNNSDLVAYAKQAWENQWGYVWGTFGQILSPSLLQSKLNQYPDNVGIYHSFIKENWLNRPTTDCVGLIKGYGWLDPTELTINYGTNGMPDIGANGMYNSATVKGSISTMPDTIGLAVWHDGHIGVYIGDGYVVEAMGTKYGVVKTKLDGRGWTNWLEIPYISYE